MKRLAKMMRLIWNDTKDEFIGWGIIVAQMVMGAVVFNKFEAVIFRGEAYLDMSPAYRLVGTSALGIIASFLLMGVILGLWVLALWLKVQWDRAGE